MTASVSSWLRFALRNPAGRGPELAAPQLPDWQRRLLSLLAPAIYEARAEGLKLASVSGKLAAAAADSWLTKPPIGLIRLVTGPFVVDMNAARHLETAPHDVSNWFEHHLEFLSSPQELQQFFERYPLLAQLTHAGLTGWRDAGVEFAVRLASDIQAIERLIGAGPLQFLDVQPGLGDVHSHGRTVARVSFDGGQVAYKPHPAGAAVGLRNLLEQLEVLTGRALHFSVPRTIDCVHYGWMAWIDSTPCQTLTDLAYFYHGLGQLSAVAWLLGSSDLHSENIVANGNTPYIVDVETLLSPILKHAEGAHTHPARGLLLESPMSTGLLPLTRTIGDDVRMDFSAIGDAPEQTGGAVTTWDFVGTTDMVAVPRNLPRDAPKSMPAVIEGEQQDALDFEAQINAGFREALVFLQANALDIVADLLRDEHLWPARSCRFILRNTFDYAQITALLWHPAVLHDPKLAEGGVKALRDDSIVSDEVIGTTITTDELAALYSGDVPYFQTCLSDRHLYDSDGKVLVAEFFDGSPLDRVDRRISRLTRGVAPLNWTTAAAIRAAKINRRRSPRGNAHLNTLSLPPSNPVPLLSAANAVAERICDLACVDGGDVSWLTLRVDRDSQWQVVPMDRSLYLGTTGVLLFLQTLKSVASLSCRVDSLRRHLLKQWESTDVDAITDLGAFDGLAGDLYLAHRLRKVAPWLEKRRAALVSRLGVTGEELDIVSGAAGIVLVLCRETNGNASMRQRLLRAATPHVEQLLEQLVQTNSGGAWPTVDGRFLVGFAHGVTGIAYGLMEFIATFPESHLVRPITAAIRSAHSWQDSVFNRDAGNWPDLRDLPERITEFSYSWCNGSAGIGIARASAIARGIWETDSLQADVEFAVSASIQYGLGTGQALCHGDLGVAELLLTASSACKRPQWISDSRRIAGMVASDIISTGGITTEEFGPDVDIPGLIVGAAGIGYELLRVAAPSVIPSILCLEG